MSVCEQITQLKHHILIIDDDRDYFKRAAQMLLDEYEVQLLDSIEVGIKLLTECTRYPDIIVLSLPACPSQINESYQSLQEWAFEKDIPILFASEYVEEQRKRDASLLTREVYDFIDRPLKPAELRIRLRNQLKLHQDKKEAENASYIDPITGIGNARKFNEQVFRRWNECLRKNKKMAILLVDIDNFKGFNQHHGLNYGDLVLQMIAEELQSLATNVKDSLCTLEGNQFALLKPFCSGYELESIADKVITKVQGLQIRNDASDEFNFLTVSVGGYSMYPEEDLTHKTLLQEADLSLFNAKTSGGNCAELRTRHAVANIFELGFGEAIVETMAS
jgi:diguanylate cyclase (GGDEF)-like protein